MDLLSLQPHKVSRDLSGYITFLYGAPKVGKTTLATQMDGALLLAFEPGYNSLPGVIAQDITSWAEMKQAYRELKKPEVREHFKAVVVDTVDIASERCKKYVCNQLGIEDLGDIGFGKGWTKFKDEFNDVFRGLTQLGYAVFFIGHDKEVTVKGDDGKDKIVIRPALSASVKTVIAGMADIYGYAHQVRPAEPSVLTLRCTDGSIECGCRFKYIDEEIPMNYQSLANTLNKAIEKEAAEKNNQFVTDEKIPVIEEKKYDFPAMMELFQNLVGDLMAKPANEPKITAIVEKYLGKGKKVSNCTQDQAEQLDLILTDLKELQ